MDVENKKHESSFSFTTAPSPYTMFISACSAGPTNLSFNKTNCRFIHDAPRKAHADQKQATTRSSYGISKLAFLWLFCPIHCQRSHILCRRHKRATCACATELVPPHIRCRTPTSKLTNELLTIDTGVHALRSCSTCNYAMNIVATTNIHRHAQHFS